jgi:transcriptional regulator with XRE-family HTH domain
MAERRMSQATLARRLGIGRAALRRLLGSSVASTHIRFLAKVAVGLNMRVLIEFAARGDAPR